MARRRSLSRQISLSEQIDQLSDRAALLFTWMIPHADDYGRLPGSVKKLTGMVIPLRRGREGWTYDDIEQYLQEMEMAVDDEGLPLITRYQANGTRVIQLTGFEKHQDGLHKRTKSLYPDPPVSDVVDNSDSFPGNSGKVSEVEGKVVEFPGNSGVEERREKREERREVERSAAVASISSMIDRSAKSVPASLCQEGDYKSESVGVLTEKEACGGGVSGGGELIKIFEGEFGRPVSPLEADQIFAMSGEFGLEVVKEALKRATLAGRPTLRYVNGILCSWRMNNCRSIREVLEYEAGIEKLKLGRKGNGDSNGNGNRDSPVDRLKLEKRNLEESVNAAIDYMKLQLGDKPSLQDVKGFFEKYDYGPEVRDRVLEMYSSGGEPP